MSDGTGLGLDIVSQISEAHGWDISVKGRKLGGERFEITGVQEID
jgi:signal transduction histidine kinase